MIERGPPTEVIYFTWQRKLLIDEAKRVMGRMGGRLAWHQLPASHQALLFSYKVNADGWQRPEAMETCDRQAIHAGTETAD